ncbi:MAG TPA: helix-turn-helix transcriptional regulator [Polyangia bacterium]|jgi:DNA-binding transcriptional regulator YiaG|nr:helix-turn-helix transcriptional regulator [Polyangia bacterium]
MDTNTAQEKDAERAERLAERVRAAQLPPPEERLRIRRDARVTLRDIADVLSVTPMTVHRWESGEVQPRLDQAAAYARVLAKVQAATVRREQAGA